MRTIVVCPECGHRETKDTKYTLIRCSKCGRLYEPNEVKKTRQETLG